MLPPEVVESPPPLPADGPATPAEGVPPVPVVTDEQGKPPGNLANLPPPPGLGRKAAEDADDDAVDAAAERKRLRPEQRPAFKVAVAAAALVLIGGLGFGAFYLFTLLGTTTPDPAPAPVAAPAPAPATNPAATPASAAGQLINQAATAAAAHAAVVDETDAVSDDPVVAPVPDPATPPAVVIDDTPPIAAPTAIEPSVEFRSWVGDTRITGVREGSQPRAFINGALYRPGDVLDFALGITFDSLDDERNLIIFRDRKGAVVGKKY